MLRFDRGVCQRQRAAVEMVKWEFPMRNHWWKRAVVACGLCGIATSVIVGVPALDASPPAEAARAEHPDTTGVGWRDLFDKDFSNAIRPSGVWTVEDGVLTASEDQAIWTKEEYENFVLDLEFKNAPGTNSGVIVYCTDRENWIPNSVEIQIADDFDDKWGNADKTWQCAAIFGHLAASHRVVKRPGEWNRYTITCRGQQITVVQNGELVTDMDMSQWTSATENPDGSKIPPWLNRPFSELATKGHIGLQGKHGDATVWFRNVRIKSL